MSESQIADKLKTELGNINASFKAVSWDRLDEVKGEIGRHVEEGEVCRELFDQYLASFAFEEPEEVPGAKTVLVIAVPQGNTVVTIQRQGREIAFTIPASYLFRESRGRCESVLDSVLGKAGFCFAWRRLPVKIMAARSGLGKYGKNNILYVEGMGSFLRLEAFVTDCPLPENSWSEPKMLDSCAKCAACAKKCPTGIIGGEMAIVNAIRCLTHLNENEGDFPDWVGPDAHNAVIGCLKCQQVCPENRPFVDRVDIDGGNNGIHKRGTFSKEETDLILKGTPEKDLPAALQEKLKQLEMDDYYNLLPRNMGVLLG